MGSAPSILPPFVLVAILGPVFQGLNTTPGQNGEGEVGGEVDLDQSDRPPAVPARRSSDDHQAIEQPTRSAAQADNTIP
jgi:hypothetical protein